jgi:hypothetical protein
MVKTLAPVNVGLIYAVVLSLSGTTTNKKHYFDREGNVLGWFKVNLDYIYFKKIYSFASDIGGTFYPFYFRQKIEANLKFKECAPF